MEKGFTLVEVIILFVIFITVALLVIPLSVDDAVITKNTAKWQHVQSGFSSIPISLMNSKNYQSSQKAELEDFIVALIKIHPLRNVVNYKIKYMNGDNPDKQYVFDEIYNTDNGAAVAFKWFDETDVRGEDKICGILMYDVNGKRGPNVWGKDVFGMNIFNNKVEPFGKNEDPSVIETDCSRQGTGVYCSAYYLSGGH
ncbi:MAG: type II secretion system GspH family protein [Candidatus Gastranaerophilales bacterium]|nr:type II secretion system GspH family protein [Candidatus Gastranaerophilales bacterium]